MVKIVRMAKIGKLIRLMRLIKLFKVMKNSANLKAHFGRSLQISHGLERLFICFLQFVFANHIFACIWCLLGQFEEASYNNAWFVNFHPSDAWEIYINAFYFTVTTMTTVGYGDMSARTTPERIFCIILMVVGVIVFTFISGAIASVISNYDEQGAILSEQMLYLNKI